MRLKIRNKLFGGFSIILLLFVIVCLYALNNVYHIYDHIKTTIDHPLVVTTITEKIGTQITSMHRHMKDVSISENKQEKDEYINLVNEEEQNVINNFNLLYSKILCDECKEITKETKQKFINWRPIREKVIKLVNDGDYKAAQNITQTEGNEYVQMLMINVAKILDYAAKSAMKLNEESYEIVKHTRLSIIISLVVGTLVSFILAFYLSVSIIKRLNEVGMVTKSMANWEPQ